MALDPEAALQQARRQKGCGCRRVFLLALLAGLLLLLLAIGRGFWPADEVLAPEVVSTPAVTTTHEAPVAEGPPPTGQRMLRLDRGTILRRSAKSQASIALFLPDAALLRVLEQRGAWYRVDTTSLDLEEDDAWVHLEDGSSRELRIQTVWQTPRPSRRLSASRRALAVEHLGAAWTTGRCGPYELLTDVRDQTALSACHRLADGLDAAYQRRFGVEPVGKAGETLILFRHLDGFRDFVRAEGLSSVGYAGHANASGGYMVLYLGEQDLDDFAVTLVHELTHLVSWRALGGPLPRWLSEGLADGLGESATSQGIEPLNGIVGLEAEVQRLASGGGSLPSSLELASLDPRHFDARPQDRHYEHSSLLVRFLLLDDEVRLRFLDYLADLATGQPYDPERFRQHLGVSWDALDQRFERWLQEAR